MLSTSYWFKAEYTQYFNPALWEAAMRPSLLRGYPEIVRASLAREQKEAGIGCFLVPEHCFGRMAASYSGFPGF